MDISEKVAYLKGLIDGLGFDDSSKESKVILAMVDILDDLALAVADIEDGMELMSDQIDEMEDDYTGYDFDDDCDDDGDFDGELYEVTCPSCSETTCIDEDMLDEGEIYCPNCGELLEFDLDGALDGCDCGCGHNHDHE